MKRNPAQNESEWIELGRRFVREHVQPGARERDRDGVFADSAYHALWEQGLLVPNLRPGLGHERMSLADTTAFFRGLGSGPLGFCTTVLVNVLGSSPIEYFSSAELLARVHASLVKGPAFFSLAMTEARHGFDIATNESRYVDRGTFYLLNGEKSYISNAPRASHLSIFAAGEAGMSCFYVAAPCPGLVVASPLDKLGHRESQTAHFEMRGLEVPKAHRLGAEGQGLDALKKSLSRSKTLISAMAIGQAERAIDLAEEHLASRVVKGESLDRKPQHRNAIARKRTIIEAAWGLSLRAARAWDEGRDSHLEANQAKLLAAEAAEHAVSESMELVGARSYLSEHELSRMFRDVKLLAIYEGTSQILEAQISAQIASQRSAQRAGESAKPASKKKAA